MAEQIFVGRDDEVAFLNATLEKVQLNQVCQVCLIEGNAGAGKTTLVEHFAQIAEERYSEKAFVAIGKCNPQNGLNDTYLPFREILNQITGIQARFLRNSINSHPPSWLRSFADGAIEALIEFGPDLIGTFVPGTALLARLATTSISTANKKRAESRSGNQEVKKEEVRKQFSDLIRKFTQKATIILIIDDLQWADEASMDLFVHITKSLRSCPILIIGAYRSEDKEKHLLDMKRDMQTEFGEIVIDLGEVSKKKGEKFTNLFLRANRSELSDAFHSEFFRRTDGNALFTVELFRYLCEHKLIQQNEAGHWIESPEMDWNKLPSQLARLEGLMAARFDALSLDLRSILDIASIEGQNFTAQVIMHFLDLSEYDLLRILSSELDKRHNLVSEVREVPVGTTVLSNYRFVNATFHQYIYNDMSLGQRRLRHKEVAETLEKLYGANASEIAFQLARHYELSYEPKKVIQYLNLAGEQMARVSDFKKAEEIFNQALSLAKIVNDRRGQVDSIRNICGSIWILQGDKDEETQERLFEALDLTRNIEYTKGEIYILRQLGILARRKKHYSTAARYYLESLGLAKRAESEARTDIEKNEAKNSQAQALNNLGTLAMAEKAYEDAEQYFIERLNIAIELNSQHGKLFAFLNLGDLSWRKGYLAWDMEQYDTAKRHWAMSKNYLAQALDIAQSSGRKTQIASAEKSLADLAISEGNYQDASIHLQSSLSIVIDSAINSRILGNLVSATGLLHRNGEIQHAISFACFVATSPDSEDFEKEIVNRAILDIRDRYPAVDIDTILSNFRNIAGDKKMYAKERENLAKSVLKLMQSRPT